MGIDSEDDFGVGYTATLVGCRGGNSEDEGVGEMGERGGRMEVMRRGLRSDVGVELPDPPSLQSSNSLSRPSSTADSLVGSASRVDEASDVDFVGLFLVHREAGRSLAVDVARSPGFVDPALRERTRRRRVPEAGDAFLAMNEGDDERPWARDGGARDRGRDVERARLVRSRWDRSGKGPVKAEGAVSVIDSSIALVGRFPLALPVPSPSPSTVESFSPSSIPSRSSLSVPPCPFI